VRANEESGCTTKRTWKSYASRLVKLNVSSGRCFSYVYISEVNNTCRLVVLSSPRGPRPDDVGFGGTAVRCLRLRCDRNHQDLDSAYYIDTYA
jgi:hypothetical protein